MASLGLDNSLFCRVDYLAVRLLGHLASGVDVECQTQARSREHIPFSRHTGLSFCFGIHGVAAPSPQGWEGGCFETWVPGLANAA